MRTLLRILPAIVAAAVFIPLILIDRSAPNQPLTGNDIALMLPFAYQLLIPLFMGRFAEGSGYTFTNEERQGFRLLIVAGFVFVAFLWGASLTTGVFSREIIITVTAGLLYGLYDLLAIVSRLYYRKQLTQLIGLEIIIPTCIAFGVFYASQLLTTGPQIINPIAVFFMLRVLLSLRVNLSLPKPTGPPL